MTKLIIACFILGFVASTTLVCSLVYAFLNGTLSLTELVVLLKILV